MKSIDLFDTVAVQSEARPAAGSLTTACLPEREAQKETTLSSDSTSHRIGGGVTASPESKREKQRIYQRRWYAKHGDRARAYQRKYRCRAKSAGKANRHKKTVMARPQVEVMSTRTMMPEPVEKWVKNWNRIEIADWRVR